MDIDQLTSIACRVLFAGAFGLLALAVLERIAFAFDYTILDGAFTGGRLFEAAGVLMVFVIALVLRQIREAVSQRSTG